jgi:hypothetical protein
LTPLEATRLVLAFVIFTMVVAVAAPGLNLYAVAAIALPIALLIAFGQRLLNR